MITSKTASSFLDQLKTKTTFPLNLQNGYGIRITSPIEAPSPGADPGFQVRGVHLKKLRRAKGGAKFVGVFRVKNHDFTPKNHIFSNLRGGGRAPGAPPPPWIRPCSLLV